MARFTQGDVLDGRYLIEALAGKGGMGEVYRVKDQETGDLRALKVMSAQIAGDERAIERFRKESSARRLYHPHIVKTIDINRSQQHADLLYITMEYHQSQSLREWMRTQFQELGPQGLDVVLVLNIIRQAAAALAYAHGQNPAVVHRDVKPENFLIAVQDDGQVLLDDKRCPHVWLTDFGIAQLPSQGVSLHTKGFIGTESYAAPEQKAGQEVDHRADLYSLGIMLFELLTGERPEGEVEYPSRRRSDVPAKVDELIRQLRQQKPKQRTNDAKHVVAHLETILKSLSATVSPLDVPVDLDRVDFRQLRIAIQVTAAERLQFPGLPDVSQQLLDSRGRASAVAEAIELLKSGTHPALQEHEHAILELESKLSDLAETRSSLRPPSFTSNDDDMLSRLFRKPPPTVNLELPPEFATDGQPFRVTQVYVRQGDSISKGDKLFSAASGGITKTIRADSAGVIAEVMISKGDSLANIPAAVKLQSSAEGCLATPHPMDVLQAFPTVDADLVLRYADAVQTADRLTEEVRKAKILAQGALQTQIQSFESELETLTTSIDVLMINDLRSIFAIVFPNVRSIDDLSLADWAEFATSVGERRYQWNVREITRQLCDNVLSSAAPPTTKKEGQGSSGCLVLLLVWLTSSAACGGMMIWCLTTVGM